MRSSRNRLRQRTIVGLALIGTSLASTLAATASSSVSPTAPAAASVPADVRWQQTRTSLLGRHYWYQQVYRGLPVLTGYYARHVDSANRVTIVDGRLRVTAPTSLSPKITVRAARESAISALRITAAKVTTPRSKKVSPPAVLPADSSQSTDLAIQAGETTRLVWRIVHAGSTGAVESLVDATSGKVVSVKNLAKNATGEGRVFQPSPSVTLQNSGLTDNEDRNQTRLAGAYRRVPLTRLGYDGSLSGDYAKIINSGVAVADTGSFLTLRANREFEQVMAYYHVTTSQEYLQSLGFKDVNNEAQKISVNTTPDDNSFYYGDRDLLQFGRGGVDDAEDAEIIWHEYGHAMQDDQVPGFGGSGQAGAIGEGFGDYWAMTNSAAVSKGFGLGCIGEWDATSYTAFAPHCLRRIDGPKTTDDIRFEVHDDGEIWSRALFDIYRALGRTKSDTLIVESQFTYRPNTTFAQAAERVVATAGQLYGPSAAAVCRASFKARKILK